MKSVLAVILVAGCASGSTPLAPDADLVDAPLADVSESIEDGPVTVDARPDASVPDAFVPDAFVPDAFVPDAFVPDAFVPDAPPDACVPITVELLANPAFDLAPLGTGWTETRIDPSAPLIASDGIPEHSAPNAAWLGGLNAPSTTVTDYLWQDVVVPMATTQLVLTGYSAVSTEETSTTSAYDTSALALTQTNGTSIQVVRSLSNLGATGVWASFDHTFTPSLTQSLGGQTVRVRMTSTADFSNRTNFFFDTLSLRATYCP